MTLLKMRLKAAFNVLFGGRKFMYIDIPNNFNIKDNDPNTTFYINSYIGKISVKDAYEISLSLADNFGDEIEAAEGLRINKN